MALYHALCIGCALFNDVIISARRLFVAKMYCEYYRTKAKALYEAAPAGERTQCEASIKFANIVPSICDA